MPEDADVSERARFIAATIASFDARIAKVFEEQTRILVMFQLLINIGASALQKKNRARVKDFLRKYFARKAEVEEAKRQGLPVPKRRRTAVANTSNAPAEVEADDAEEEDTYPSINLATANAVEIQEWASGNKELQRQALLYVQEQLDSGIEAKKKQEEQRQALIERKKQAQQANASAAVVPLPAAASIQTPKKPVPAPLQQVAVMPAFPQQPPQSIAPVKRLGGDPTRVETDDFLYRKRAYSIEIDKLDIRGPTAESVVAQARAAIAKIISDHSKVRSANKSAGVVMAEEATYFADPDFPVVEDLDQLIEAGTDPADKPKPGAPKKKRKACWKRIREISQQPKVFSGGKLDPSLIIQGDIEDCCQWQANRDVACVIACFFSDTALSLLQIYSLL